MRRALQRALRGALLAGMLPAAGTFLPSRPAEARPPLDEAAAARVDRFEVLTLDDPAALGEDPLPAGLQGGQAVGLFDGTPDEVFRVATDYEHLADFTPRVVSSQRVEQRGDTSWVLVRTDLPWPVRNAWVLAKFAHERLDGGAFRIRFHMVRGSLRRYAGEVLIEPWSPGRTSVTYRLVAEPDTRLAPRRLVSQKVKDATGAWVNALRQHVDDLHRLGRLHPITPAPDVPPSLAGPDALGPARNVAEAGR